MRYGSDTGACGVSPPHRSAPSRNVGLSSIHASQQGRPFGSSWPKREKPTYTMTVLEFRVHGGATALCPVSNARFHAYIVQCTNGAIVTNLEVRWGSR